MFRTKTDGFFDVAFRDAALVGLGLDDGLVSEERQWWEAPIVPALNSHVIAVGNPVVAVEAVSCRKMILLIAAVPLADDFHRVSHVLEETGDRGFARVESDSLTRKQHPATVELAKADTRGIATREHRASRGRADGGGHVEIGEPGTLGGHPVESGRLVDFGAVASEVTVAEVVAVDQDDVGFQ